MRGILREEDKEEGEDLEGGAMFLAKLGGRRRRKNF
jgi:hypothetical protein